MIDYQKELNPSQCDAVLYTEGDSMNMEEISSEAEEILDILTGGAS